MNLFAKLKNEIPQLLVPLSDLSSFFHLFYIANFGGCEMWILILIWIWIWVRIRVIFVGCGWWWCRLIAYDIRLLCVEICVAGRTFQCWINTGRCMPLTAFRRVTLLIGCGCGGGCWCSRYRFQWLLLGLTRSSNWHACETENWRKN